MGRSEDVLVDGISSLCGALGVRLYDVELTPGILRVTVESDGRLDLDALSEVARQVSAFLDDHDDLAPKGRYELEVGSPGLERRLRTPAHLAGAIGERVALRLRPGVEGDRRLEGVLAGASDDELVVALDDGSTRTVVLADVERARAVFDWRRAFADDNEERRSKQVTGDGTRRKVGRR